MLLFDLSLDLDRTLAQRKAQQKAKSKVKVTHWHLTFTVTYLTPQVSCRWVIDNTTADQSVLPSQHLW